MIKNTVLVSEYDLLTTKCIRTALYSGISKENALTNYVYQYKKNNPNTWSYEPLKDIRQSKNPRKVWYIYKADSMIYAETIIQ